MKWYGDSSIDAEKQESPFHIYKLIWNNLKRYETVSQQIILKVPQWLGKYTVFLQKVKI